MRVAGNEMDEAIIQYIKRNYNLLIGERTAEQIKMEIGSAFPLDERLTMEIKGRHLIEGVPKTITISDEEIREALAETVNVIVDAVRVALERTPPELSADIVDRGIVLTGGGSMLKNLDKRLREETGLPAGHGRGSPVVRRLRRRQDAGGLQPVAQDLHRLTRLRHGHRLDRVPDRTDGQRMALPDIRNRARYLFVAVMVGHILLISSQVNSRERRVPAAGDPDDARRRDAARRVGRRGRRALRLERATSALRGVRAENERLAARGDRPAGAGAAGSGRSPTAPNSCGPCSTCATRLGWTTAAAEVIAGSTSPEFRSITIDKGARGRRGAPTWRSSRRPASSAASCSLRRTGRVRPAAHRSERGRRR